MVTPLENHDFACWIDPEVAETLTYKDINENTISLKLSHPSGREDASVLMLVGKSEMGLASIFKDGRYTGRLAEASSDAYGETVSRLQEEAIANTDGDIRMAIAVSQKLGIHCIDTIGQEVGAPMLTPTNIRDMATKANVRQLD